MKWLILTFFDLECRPAFCNCLLSIFKDSPRRFEVLEEFWMRRRKRVTCNIVHNCTVEQCLFRAMNSRVVRQARVIPRVAISVSH